VSGGWDSAVKLWQHGQGTSGGFVEKSAFYGHECAVAEVCLSECETLVLSVGRDDDKVLMHDARRSYDAVWSYDGGGGGSGSGNNGGGVVVDKDGLLVMTCSLSWLTSAYKILFSSTRHGLALLDVRKAVEPVQLIRANAAWRPQRHVTDGRRVLVGDHSGRITAGRMEDLSGITFDSSVVARHGDGITALAVKHASSSGNGRTMLIASGTRSGEVGIFEVDEW
jgi:hypothetical protein